MTVARKVASYLGDTGIQAQVLPHARSVTAARTAKISQVPPTRNVRASLQVRPSLGHWPVAFSSTWC